MASNFKIFITRNGKILHLNLIGDFDGSSAFELINMLLVHNGKDNKIVVHTDTLCSIHPFGLEVFHHYFFIKKLKCDLTFTGIYGDDIFPKNKEVKKTANQSTVPV